MTPPPGEVCPRPGAPADPASTVPCALWSARQKTHFARSIEAESAARLGMTALVYAESINWSPHRPSVPPTRPVPIEHRPIAEVVETTATDEPVAEKGVPSNA